MLVEPRELLLIGAAEDVAHIAERDAVLRPPRAGEAWLDRAQVQLQQLVEIGIRRVVRAEEPLLLAVSLDELDQVVIATREPQVGQRLLVHREESGRGAVLRRHVGERGAVRQREVAEPGAAVLDEAPDDAVLAEQLGDGEHEVGCRGTGAQRAGELEADDVRLEQVHRLAEQYRLGLDAADAPAEHTEPVDHRGVAVGADEGVRVGHRLAIGALRRDYGREIFEVDLMDNACARRHHAEVLERLLSPPKERVALAVALVLEVDVALEGEHGAEAVDLHGVVDNQIGRHQRVDLANVAAETGHRRAHRGEIDHGGNAGEVLQDHTGRKEWELPALLAGARLPAGERTHMALVGELAASIAQHVLEQDSHREREAVDRVEQAVLDQLSEPVVGHAGAIARRQLRAGAERIDRTGDIGHEVILSG